MLLDINTFFLFFPYVYIFFSFFFSIFINVFLSYKISRTDLIFGGFPTTLIGVSKGLCAGIHSREDLQPVKISIKEEADTIWKWRL